MQTLQLSDSIFVNIDRGDIFLYEYPRNTIKILVIEDYVPPIDEFTTEIISINSKRHFRFHRYGQYY